MNTACPTCHAPLIVTSYGTTSRASCDRCDYSRPNRLARPANPHSHNNSEAGRAAYTDDEIRAAALEVCAAKLGRAVVAKAVRG